jgi:hypothetical protein
MHTLFHSRKILHFIHYRKLNEIEMAECSYAMVSKLLICIEKAFSFLFPLFLFGNRGKEEGVDIDSPTYNCLSAPPGDFLVRIWSFGFH